MLTTQMSRLEVADAWIAAFNLKRRIEDIDIQFHSPRKSHMGVAVLTSEDIKLLEMDRLREKVRTISRAKAHKIASRSVL